MLTELKPYPAMKDSGVRWLGEVPDHWEIERAKWLFRKMDRPIRDNDEVITCFRDGTVTLRKNRRVRGFTESLKEIGYQGIRRGDLVIHTMDAFAGAIGVSDSDGKGTPVYSVCEPVPIANAQYYAYTVREMARSQWIQALAKGIRERSTDFRFDGFGSQPVPLPPHAEQAAIVRFLDHVDRRIRRYIRAKQTLIKRLKEQNQAIIHHAVTRGLDPNVRLKYSGVEWLGDVPEHWEIVRLGRIATVFNGTTPSRMQPAYWHNGTVPWLSSGKVNDYIVETASELVTERALKECSISIVPKGAVIIGLVGQGKTRGMAALLGIDACINQNLAGIIPRVGLSSCYLHSFLTAFYKSLREFGRGGNQEALNCEIVGGFRIPIPPLDEQRVLCEYLGAIIQDSQPAVQRIKREIELIHEYRNRLIADVVTGKVDVCKVAARLPVEVEEPEPVDEAEADNDIDADAADDIDVIPEEADA